MFTKDQINTICQAVAVTLAHVLSNMDNPGKPIPAPVQQPKAVKRVAKPKASVSAKPNGNGLSKRHATIVATFKKRGIKDPKLFTDIKPYSLWLIAGRQVKANAKSVNGLFHVSQTDPIAA